MRGSVLAKKKGRLSRTAAPDGSGCQALLLFDDDRAAEGLEPERCAAVARLDRGRPDGGRAADGILFMMGDVEMGGKSIVFRRIS